MFNNHYFGIILTFATYEIGKYINSKVKSPVANPLLISIGLCILFLKVTGISYEDYKIGGDFIAFFIAPATVAMVVSLYENFDELMKNLLPVVGGTFVGCIISVALAIILFKVMGYNKELTTSVTPQSITTAIAVSLSEEYGGNAPITAISVVIRGVSGAVLAPIVMKLFRIKDPVAQGVAIGTASHAVGTAEARVLGEVQGAMSGLSIAVAGIITVFLMPVAMNVIGSLY